MGVSRFIVLVAIFELRVVLSCFIPCCNIISVCWVVYLLNYFAICCFRLLELISVFVGWFEAIFWLLGSGSHYYLKVSLF